MAEDEGGEADVSRQLVRDASLELVTSFERTIGASTTRVWENVLDWEHLPWLHSSVFAGIDCKAAGEWGWCAEARYPGGDSHSSIELCVDRQAGHYVTRVLDGVNAGGEIWTRLSAAGPRATDIVVEFFTAPVPGVDLALLGPGLVALYQQLWDEDEGMMQMRQSQLDRLSSQHPPRQSMRLGSMSEIRRGLPYDFEFAGAPFRIIDLDGELVVHSKVCPHALGPLSEQPLEGGQLRCPWHGYLFAPRSGHSCDGKGLRLMPAPRLEIDPASDEAMGIAD